jgi:acetyl-CoA carboxylase carboxyl transferase subunit alpha
MSGEPILLDFEKPLMEFERNIAQIRQLAEASSEDFSEQVNQLEYRAAQLRQEIFANLTPEQRLKVARHPSRPSTLDYIQGIFEDWVELHGDRAYSDDPAMVGGVACLKMQNENDGQPVVIIGQQKGRDTKDNIMRNFGMPQPDGYRKALRLMEHANRFEMPILTFIDTPGAYPGLEAENRGQGEAIARNLREMFSLEVPIICTVIGEGMSGGALGIGIGDRVFMLEHAVYSVISPESCSSILWRDVQHIKEAARSLKITAFDLKSMNIIDQIIPEPPGGAHRAPVDMARTLKDTLSKSLQELQAMTGKERRSQRYQKFRAMGQFLE